MSIENSNGNNPEQRFEGRDQAELLTILAAQENDSAKESAPQIREERRNFSGGEIIRMMPDETRIDLSTGEPVIPLLFAQGIVADKHLSADLQQLATNGHREVIALMYKEKLGGNAKLTEEEGIAAPVPELDLDQADDILDALDELGINQVDVVAVSRGSTRALAAVEKSISERMAAGFKPNRFRNVLLFHPAGLDGRNSRERHYDAGRAMAYSALDKIRGRRPKLPDNTETEANIRSLARDPRGVHQETLSVSRAQNKEILTDAITRSPDMHAIVVADVGDKANLVERVRETVAGTGARFQTTDFGGHGTQRERDATFGYMDETLRRMESERIGANREPQ